MRTVSKFRRSPRTDEGGSALVVALVLTVSVAALVVAHLGEVGAEGRRIRVRLQHQRAIDRAIGALERAQNIVNASPYLHGQNAALWAATHSADAVIPGTEVTAMRIGDSEWYRLRATQNVGFASGNAEVFVRQRTPLSAYHLFVSDHPVGVSGNPVGRIHTNKSLEFMFPYGTYTDSISASEGYEFIADATPENTRIWGPSNPAAPAMPNALKSIRFLDLREQASLSVRDDLLAEVQFLGKRTKVELFTPETRTLVPRTGVRRVFDGWDLVERKRKVASYLDVPYRIRVPVYREVTEHVTQKIPKYRWHTVTRARRETVYEDRVEHYFEREAIWGTKFIARSSYETDYVTRAAAETPARALLRLIEEAERLEGLNGADGTEDAADAAGAPKAKDPKGKKPAEVNLKKERDNLRKAHRHLSKAPPEYDKAIDDGLKVSKDKKKNKWIDELSPDAKALVEDWYTHVNRVLRSIDNEKKNGPTVQTDYGDLSSVDLAELQEIRSHGNALGGAGHVELRATHEFVEIPYIMRRKLVRKTRLKRKRAGERLVTSIERIRRFSHNESRHVLRKRRVLQGESWVQRTRRVATGWKVITESVQVPRYRSESFTYLEEVIVPRKRVRTEVVDSAGLIYFEHDITKLEGDVNGQVTIASGASMTITGSIRYVDDSGRTRMLHGDDPAEAYLADSEYRGDSVLLLLSRGNIRYSKDVPENFELNATLVSTQGNCAMEGIEVSPNGKEVSVSEDAKAKPSDYVKESMRRLGGILSAKRPVATYIDSDKQVLAGFRQGSALMDKRLLPASGGATIPPHAPMLDQPTWGLRSVGRKIVVSN